MRRLVTLVSVLVFVDTTLFAALTPLLGRFAHELHLSTATAGVLVAAYAAGALLGSLPGGVTAARLGPRRAVLAGLALMGVASLGFAWSESFGQLLAARLVQGAGSGFTWAGSFAWLMAAAPRERRGALIGTAMGAAVVGALAGPIVGSAAALLGRGGVFTAVAALSALLGVVTVSIPSRAPESPSAGAMRRAVRNDVFIGGLGLLALASLLSGVVAVLAPLELTHHGWGPAAIGAVWLIAAAIEAAQSPLIGRLSDRHGPLAPVRYALMAGAAASLALIVGLAPLPYTLAIVAASIAFGILFTPAFALIADGADRVGLAQGMAFGMMNVAWALGAIAGPAGAGVLADATGEGVPFALALLGCLACFGVIARRSRAPLARTQMGG